MSLPVSISHSLLASGLISKTLSRDVENKVQPREEVTGGGGDFLAEVWPTFRAYTPTQVSGENVNFQDREVNWMDEVATDLFA